MSVAGPSVGIAADETVAPAGWDARAVDTPGGHVMQSAAWGAYRASQGFEPRYLTFDDGHAALALLRRTPGLPGVSATVRRGPPHAGETPGVAGERAAALAGWARGIGARDLFIDPERPADPAYAAAMDAAGFAICEGVEPSSPRDAADLRLRDGR